MVLVLDQVFPMHLAKLRPVMAMGWRTRGLRGARSLGACALWILAPAAGQRPRRRPLAAGRALVALSAGTGVNHPPRAVARSASAICKSKSFQLQRRARFVH